MNDWDWESELWQRASKTRLNNLGRDIEIYKSYKSTDATYADLAKTYRLSKARINQIVSRIGKTIEVNEKWRNFPKKK